MAGAELKEWTVQAAAQYERTHQQYVGGARKLEALINELIGEEEGINYLSATARAKEPESFLAKASKPHPDDPARPKYDDPLNQITDLVAARIITFLVEAVDRVCEVIESEFEIVEHTDMGAHTRAQGAFGYASKHYLVRLNSHRRELPEYAVLKNLTMEIQVRTAVQHAWAEFEHDIRYKGSIPEEHARDLDRRFTLAAGLLELADREFSAIRERIQASMTEQQLPTDAADPRISAQDLATFLAGRYADAGWSRTDHYAWISGLLLELGISSLDELAELLGSVDTGAIHARMGYRQPTRAVRRLDDALLAVFGERYLGLHGNTHRLPLLTARLAKLTATPAPTPK